MEQKYSSEASALVTSDEQGRTRSIVYPDHPGRGDVRGAAALGAEHLRGEGQRYGISDIELAHVDEPPAKDMTDDGVEYRLRRSKRIMDTVVLDYCQTLFGLPVWRAGVSVVVKDRPKGVIGSTFTGLDGLAAERPSRSAMRSLRTLKPDALGQLLGLERLQEKLVNGRLLLPRINSIEPWIYRYHPADRQVEAPQDDPPPPVGLAGDLVPLPHQQLPTIPLPPVPDAIEAGRDYIVMEVLFTTTIEPWGELNWRAFVEPEHQVVLYLRALVDHVNGLVFPNDPVTLSGNAANNPASTTATLNPLRQSVSLLGLDPPSGTTQSLAGDFVVLQDAYAPPVSPPTRTTGSNFDYGSRTNDFAAVNAYHHSDSCFRLVDGMGLNNPTPYFDGTTFPVVVEHRGSGDFDGIFGGPTDNNGNQVNAQSLGNGTSNGCGALNFFLADTTDTGNPLGIAADKRVVLHEFGHSIMWDHVNGPNFGFAHSAGDSLAAILSDPASNAPDRFSTFPFTFQSLPAAAARRHDRGVAAGWGWGGVNDTGIGPGNPGYQSEQVLSTTLFRFYRAIGGDSAQLARRASSRRGSSAYLIFRAVGMLTPAANAPNAIDFANALMLADAGEWTSEGLAGGAYHKVIRWAFEKQGLYQPPGAPTPVVSRGRTTRCRRLHRRRSRR